MIPETPLNIIFPNMPESMTEDQRLYHKGIQEVIQDMYGVLRSALTELEDVSGTFLVDPDGDYIVTDLEEKFEIIEA